MAIDFKGTSTIVRMAVDPPLDHLPSISVAFWMNLADVSGTDYVYVHFDAGATKYHRIYLSGTSFMTFVHSHTLGEATAQTGSIAGLIGQWTHVVCRCDGNDSPRAPDVLFDGVDVTASRTSTSGVVRTTDGQLSIAAEGTENHLNARLADFAIFDRALTDQEVRTLYSGRLRAAGLAPVLHLPFDGEEGDEIAGGEIGITDTSGYGNHIDGGSLINRSEITRDPPLHWPVDPEALAFAGRATRNSRPTMNVGSGTKLATMRRAV